MTPGKSPRVASAKGAGSRIRIDTLLVDRGLAASRERAQALVMAGAVVVGTAHEGERRVDKPGVRVAASASVRVRGEDHPYVSRGGLKLAAALDGLGVDCTGRVALDVGASTGGFTDCLLQRGAIRVLAVDVGYGQFAWKLRQDPRVVLFERQNIRHLCPDRLPVTPELVVIDVSFISLELVLGPLRTLCLPGAAVLALVKPQFEVGKGNVGKGGVVRDPGLRQQATHGVAAAATGLGYVVIGALESPVPGPKGNIETFLHLRAPQ